jgi:hypothetical protein
LGLAGEGSWTWMVGVGGFDSPRTAVVGRKREAMMTRWLRREDMVDSEEHDEEKAGKEAMTFYHLPSGDRSVTKTRPLGSNWKP